MCGRKNFGRWREAEVALVRPHDREIALHIKKDRTEFNEEEMKRRQIGKLRSTGVNKEALTN